MTTYLLPCPFCGFQPDADDDDCIYPTTRDRKVWKLNCYETAGGCTAKILGSSPEDCIEKWNKRAAPSAAVQDAPPPRLHGFMRKRLERACDEAEHPKGMSTHDGMVRVPAHDIRRLLAVIDAAPAVADAPPPSCCAYEMENPACPIHGHTPGPQEDAPPPNDRRDAERYREFRRAVYIDKDESFDAYDEDGMDAELDRRIAARRAVADAPRTTVSLDAAADLVTWLREKAKRVHGDERDRFHLVANMLTDLYEPSVAAALAAVADAPPPEIGGKQ